MSIYWIMGICLAAVIVLEFFEKEKPLSKPWGLVGISFIIGISIFGMFLVQSKKSETGLKVVGYANKMFQSDMVKWNLTLQQTCSTSGLRDAYSKMASDVEAFKAYLLESKIPEKDISIQPVNSNPMYSSSGEITSYSVTQNIFILSSDVQKVEELSLKPGFFAQRNILLQMSNLSYLYSKLPELKKQLLSEATADAVSRAKEIAGSAKVKLGKMREARSGVFQITEPYSNEVSDYGIYSTGTKSKSIAVTLTATFNLK